MTTITKEKIQAIHGILARLKQMDDKAEIVQSISGGRTSHTNELYEEEATEWIKMMNLTHGPSPRSGEGSDPRQRMINSIIAMAREMGMVLRQTVSTNCGYVQVASDYTRLKVWMNEKSYLKKPLNDYTYEELPKLVSQFKAIFASWLKK